MQEENLAVIEIKVCPVAVKANLGNSLTEMVVGVVALVISTIEIMEELVVFIKYKASELEVFGVTITVAITVAKRVGKGVKIIK